MTPVARSLPSSPLHSSDLPRTMSSIERRTAQELASHLRPSPPTERLGLPLLCQWLENGWLLCVSPLLDGRAAAAPPYSGAPASLAIFRFVYYWWLHDASLLYAKGTSRQYMRLQVGAG